MAEKSELIAVVKAEIGDLKTKMDQASQKLEGVKTKSDATSSSVVKQGQSFKSLVGGMGAMLGVSAGVSTAIAALKGIISSTQLTSDSLAIALGGVKESMSQLAITMATLDFDNFGQNMLAALKAGQEYAKTVDDLEDRIRALKIRESELSIESIQLLKIGRDVSKSDQERIAAIEKMIALEKSLMQERQTNATMAFNNELQLAASRSNLTEDEIKEYLRLYDKKNELISQTSDYLKAQREVNFNNSVAAKIIDNLGFGFGRLVRRVVTTKDELEQYKEVLSNPNEEVAAFLRIEEGMNKLDDTMRQKLVDSWTTLNSEMLAFETSTQRAETTLNGLKKSFEEDKLKKYTDEWARLTKELVLLDSISGSLTEKLNNLLENVAVPKLTFDLEEEDIFDPIEQEAIAHANWMRDWASGLQQSIHSLLVEGLVDSLDMLGTAMGAALSGKDFDGDEFLMMIADWAKKLGAILVASGLAVFSFQSQLPFNPLAVAGLGGALIVAAAAVKGALSQRPTTGVSSSYGGGGGGQGADLFGLRSLGQFAVSVTGEITGKGSDLVAVINQENNRLNY